MECLEKLEIVHGDMYGIPEWYARIMHSSNGYFLELSHNVECASVCYWQLGEFEPEEMEIYQFVNGVLETDFVFFYKVQNENSTRYNNYTFTHIRLNEIIHSPKTLVDIYEITNLDLLTSEVEGIREYCEGTGMFVFYNAESFENSLVYLTWEDNFLASYICDQFGEAGLFMETYIGMDEDGKNITVRVSGIVEFDFLLDYAPRFLRRPDFHLLSEVIRPVSGKVDCDITWNVLKKRMQDEYEWLCQIDSDFVKYGGKTEEMAFRYNVFKNYFGRAKNELLEANGLKEIDTGSPGKFLSGSSDSFELINTTPDACVVKIYPNDVGIVIILKSDRDAEYCSELIYFKKINQFIGVAKVVVGQHKGSYRLQRFNLPIGEDWDGLTLHSKCSIRSEEYIIEDVGRCRLSKDILLIGDRRYSIKDDEFIDSMSALVRSSCNHSVIDSFYVVSKGAPYQDIEHAVLTDAVYDSGRIVLRRAEEPLDKVSPLYACYYNCEKGEIIKPD